MFESWYPFVVAPMVGQSEWAFRVLCREYGATVCYSPMWFSKSFPNINETDNEKTNYRNACLADIGVDPQGNYISDLNAKDRPLVVQFCGNDPKVLLNAALQVQDYCDAIDINLGCPQRRAKEDHFGAYLLGKSDWPLVESLVTTLSQNLKIPVFCKIRLHGLINETIQFCHMLQNAGCKLITVHGRFASQTKRRHGLANLDSIKLIKEALSIPVVSNGNIRNYEDAINNLKKTNADAVMSAETLLNNPSLFANIEMNEEHALLVCFKYLKYCEINPPPVKWAVQHILHILEFLFRKHWDVEEKIKESVDYQQLDSVLCAFDHRIKNHEEPPRKIRY